ncbi:unnamed protein product [Caenorhabditis bovis]|uniref:THUMP domain-containing protein n=1 Tax=Caenorhabditis bovis TaxID=2654633 RepID=A0A8S1E329_9PELO|nr:unnamed protein product [Caenorhabditis bovis]
MGDENRKRTHNYWNNKVKQNSVEPGASGLFFTCEGREKQAVYEAYSIIDEFLDDYSNGISTSNPNIVNEDDSQNSDEDIADALKKACNNERKSKLKHEKRRRCIQRPTGIKNCIFISVKDANINLLAEKMVDLAQKSPRCRCLHRVLPVEYTAQVDINKLNEIIMKIVSENLKPRENGTLPTYSVEFKTRNNDRIDKSTILGMVNDAVSAFAPNAKVNLNHADITFYIQLCRKTIMAGICRSFYDRKKYSMRPTKNIGDAPDTS